MGKRTIFRTTTTTSTRISRTQSQRNRRGNHAPQPANDLRSDLDLPGDEGGHQAHLWCAKPRS